MRKAAIAGIGRMLPSLPSRLVEDVPEGPSPPRTPPVPAVPVFGVKVGGVNALGGEMVVPVGVEVAGVDIDGGVVLVGVVLGVPAPLMQRKKEIEMNQQAAHISRDVKIVLDSAWCFSN
ncbi:hypothetical protein Cni_G03142 [Canna indica]|uniref:Uncharacterized protein n=1 Tax=Canna indica TaxID=4628 RepID=A0AAQ3Q0V0_9LILI|nr:hypothetical protein Cni_G03142 [Canna indica]